MRKVFKAIKSGFIDTFFASIRYSNLNAYQKKQVKTKMILECAKITIAVALIFLGVYIYFLVDDLVQLQREKIDYMYLDFSCDIAIISISLIVIIALGCLFNHKSERSGLYSLFYLSFYIIIIVCACILIYAGAVREKGFGDPLSSFKIPAPILFISIVLIAVPFESRWNNNIFFISLLIGVIIAAIRINCFDTAFASNIIAIVGAGGISNYTYGRFLKLKIDELELNETNNKLLLKAELDDLTQLYNRYALKTYMSLKKVEWRKTKTSVGLLMIDIDDFKKYNDAFSHVQGDNCLRLISQCMKRVIEDVGGLAYRYGGEEFLVIIPNCNADMIMQIAKSLHKNIASLKIASPETIKNKYMTVSIGASIQTEFIDDSNEWILNVDNQLYNAKSSGKNCTSYQNIVF